MTKKRWIAAAILVGCVSMILVGFAILSPRQTVSEESFAQIENGLTMGIVESILGGRSEANARSAHFWTGEEGGETLFVSIEFDAQKKVSKKTLQKRRLSLPNRLLWRLGLSIL